MTNSPSKPASSIAKETSSPVAPAIQRLKQENLSWSVWLAIGYAGVILPVSCHLVTSSEPPDVPSWQSGKLHDKLGYVLSGKAGYVLYPLLFYPVVCLSLLLIREERFANNYLVRFGIMTGLPVGTWYCIVFGLVICNVTDWLSPQWGGVLLLSAFGILTPFFLWATLRALLWTRRKLHIPWVVVIGLSVIGLTAGIVYTIVVEGSEGIIGLPFVVLFLSIFFGPYWCFDAYLAMTLRLLWRYPQRVRFTIAQLMATMSWLGAFLAACRWAVILSLEEYSKLPLEPPETCYIATAAARGHPRFVGSWSLKTRHGAIRNVNRQLVVLKAGELALSTLTPRLHRGLRAVYDVVAPPIARRLAKPVVADAAFLVLKPIEWVTYLCLLGLLGRQFYRIDRLFVRGAIHIRP